MLIDRAKTGTSITRKNHMMLNEDSIESMVYMSNSHTCPLFHLSGIYI